MKVCPALRCGTSTPGRTRTCNFQFRRLTLYPIELRAHHTVLPERPGATASSVPFGENRAGRRAWRLTFTHSIMPGRRRGGKKGALPAAVSLRFGDLYIAPRLHALSSPGIVMLWVYIVFELGKLVRHAWGRKLAHGLLIGAIVIQNAAFLGRQRALFTSLSHAYQRVLGL